jgi:hypothetical protein
MSDSAAETIKGVISRLKAVGSVTALVSTRIYTMIPQKETFPYIRVGMTGDDYSGKDFTGMMHALRIQAFSRDRSPKEVLDIRQAVYNALNRNEINVTISGYNLVSLQQGGAIDFFQESDGKTWQSVLDFRVVVT